MKLISFHSAVFLILLALFCHHEILSNDAKKVMLLNIIQKAVDFLYCLFVEDYIFLFLGTYIFSSRYIQNPAFNQVAVATISLSLFMISVLLFLSNKFRTYDISTIISILQTINPNDLDIDAYGNKFGILARIEDSSFFKRSRFFHTLLSPSISFGLFKHISIKEAGSPFCLFRKVFCRGYSTIEMQLIRTLGVKSGYEKMYYQEKNIRNSLRSLNI